MVGPGEQEDQNRQRWNARLARGRLGLSASVDATLADPKLDEDEFLDESMEVDEIAQSPSGAMLIRPRLSLQSKQLPAVRIVPGEAEKTAANDTLPVTHPVETPPTGQKKKRLAGRNTKVHLQAVPKQEKKAVKKSLAESPKNELASNQEMPAVIPLKEGITEAPVTVKVMKDSAPVREKLAGTGHFLKGYAEVTIENAHITLSSVVMVTLLGDPGPVVVQYYTLLPAYGFTVHLSSPAKADTPFNYVILLGELF